MTLVVDSSVVVAALLDGGEVGQWAAEILASGPVAAPHVLAVEVAHVLRRAEGSGAIAPVLAEAGHEQLLALPVDLYPYGELGVRAWELRSNVTSYDAWYVALAEALGCPLATLDGRLTRSTGPRCAFLTP